MSDRIRAGYLDSIAIVRSTKEFTLHAAGAAVVDGNSATFEVGDYIEGLLVLDATAIAGTSVSVAFTLQTKVNNEWVAVPGVTIAAVVAAAVQTIPVTNFGDEIRLLWDLNGTTTSVTFSASFKAKS